MKHAQILLFYIFLGGRENSQSVDRTGECQLQSDLSFHVAIFTNLISQLQWLMNIFSTCIILRSYFDKSILIYSLFWHVLYQHQPTQTLTEFIMYLMYVSSKYFLMNIRSHKSAVRLFYKCVLVRCSSEVLRHVVS